MTSSSQLQSRIRAELARRFGNDRATEIMEIITDKQEFDDDALKEDVKDIYIDDDDSLLRGDERISVAEFECIRRVCNSDNGIAAAVPVEVTEVASSSQLQSRIRVELARRFGNDRATEIMSIVIDEQGFDDDNLKKDVKEEDDSLLRDKMSAAEFEFVQRFCNSDSETALSVPVEVAQVARVAQAVNIDEFLINKDRSGWSTAREDTLTLYMMQLPLAITGHKDAAFLNMLTLGRYHKNFLLMMNIADTFARRRILQFIRDGSQLQPVDFVNALSFYAKLSRADNAAAKFNVTSALGSYEKRFIRSLELKPTELFLDKVDDILRYIFAVSKMLHSVLFRLEMELTEELDHDYDPLLTINLPFQFDLVIIPHGKKKKLNSFQVLDPDDDEDDEDDEDDDGKEKDVDKPVTANITSGLKKFGIKFETFVMEQDILENGRKCKRLLRDRFSNLLPQKNGRYVMVVDRRADNNSPDKVYAFSPKCAGGGDDDEKLNVAHVYHQLHQDFVPESLVYKTLKCLIPSASASAEGPHFGCHQRDCITISFHILARNLKKCYMFINGTGARMEATDLIELLPTFFGGSATAFKRQDVETVFGLELQDEQFTDWYNKTTTMS